MNLFLPKPLSRRLASLASAPHLLVCSDYDGTLAPIAPRPEQARLLPGAFDILHRLARLPDTRVAIISGRARDNLRAHSGLDLPVLLAGSHGAELPVPTPYGEGMEQQGQLDALESALVTICATSPGAWVERKPFGMAVHVREATRPDAERVLEEVGGMLASWPMMQVTEGKAVIELSLAKTGKGDAVQWLRDDWGTDPQVLYLGDDVTDEKAFGVLGPADVGIKIGAGPSVAEYRVASEREALGVLNFLQQYRASMLGRCNIAQQLPAIAKT